MKIIEKDVTELAAGDLIIEVSEVVKRMSGSPVLISSDKYFILVEESGKEDSNETHKRNQQL